MGVLYNGSTKSPSAILLNTQARLQLIGSNYLAHHRRIRATLLTNHPRRTARLVPSASLTIEQQNNDNTMGRLFQSNNPDNNNNNNNNNNKTQNYKSSNGKSSHLLPISFNNGSITYTTNTTTTTTTTTPLLLLDNLPSTITSTSSNNMIILGARSSHHSPVSMEDITLGNLQCRRWMCCARKKLWWMAPEWGTSVRQLPPETQFLLLELDDGVNYAIVLPLIDNNTFRSTLRPPRYGTPEHASEKLILRIESGDDTVKSDTWHHILLLAVSPNPYSLVDLAITKAASLSGGARPLSEKKLPPAINVFGFCTWDAFYSSVSASGVIAGVQSLASGGAPPKWVVIDDGWQQTDLDVRFKRDPLALPHYESLLKMGKKKRIEGDLDVSTLSMLKKGLSIKKEKKKAGNSSDDGNGSAEDGDDTGDGVSQQREQQLMELQEYEDDNRAATEEAAAAADGIDGTTRESFIEGEIEILSMAAKEIPAGSATGAILAEIIAVENNEPGSSLLNAELLAYQHVAEERAVVEAALSSRRRRKPLVFRLTGVAAQYVGGLMVGAFQALILLFYIWLVDKADYGTWPVSVFDYLTKGVLKKAILQFYADSTIFTRRLIDIKANSKFSSPDATATDINSHRKEDLKGVVTHIKESLGVEYIYVWHSLACYWSGVAPTSPAMLRYSPQMVFAKPTESLKEVEPSLLWNPAVLAGVGIVNDVASLFQDMHSYLAESGVDGIKVDSQAGVGMVGSMVGGGPAAAARFHAALEDSAVLHFPSNDVINCMAHSTENIYRWRDTAVARASDDFYPTDKASHVPHITACAFNGLFLSALAMTDYDMFHSNLKDKTISKLHATARAVSGGPVYVSDVPGSHSFDILKQLVLPGGSILRALLPARPSRDCLFTDVRKDEGTLLKLWNVNRCNGILGIFNVQGSGWDRTTRRFKIHNPSPPTLSTIVRVSDIEPFAAGAAASEILLHAASSSSSTREEDKNDDTDTGKKKADQSSPLSRLLSSAMRVGSGNYNSSGNGTSSGTTNTVGASAAAIGAARHLSKGCGGITWPEAFGDGDLPAWWAVYVSHTRQLHKLYRGSGLPGGNNNNGDDGNTEEEDGIPVTLDARMSTVITVAPIRKYGGLEFAPIGLVNMLNGGGAVLFTEAIGTRGVGGVGGRQKRQGGFSSSFRIKPDPSSSSTTSFSSMDDTTISNSDNSMQGGGGGGGTVVGHIKVGVRGRGTLLVYCSKEPVECLVEGFTVAWVREGNNLRIDVPYYLETAGTSSRISGEEEDGKGRREKASDDDGQVVTIKF